MKSIEFIVLLFVRLFNVFLLSGWYEMYSIEFLWKNNNP